MAWEKYGKTRERIRITSVRNAMTSNDSQPDFSVLESEPQKEIPETSEKSCHRFQGTSRDSCPTVCCNISQHLG